MEMKVKMRPWRRVSFALPRTTLRPASSIKRATIPSFHPLMKMARLLSASSNL